MFLCGYSILFTNRMTNVSIMASVYKSNLLRNKNAEYKISQARVKKMVKYLQTIYSIESFSIPDSILEFPYAQNQIIAQFDRNEKQEVLHKLSLIVLF